MSVDFELPQMGFDMTEAKIARWTKREGEKVEPGEVLAEIATEKVNLELVDHPGGVVEKILVPEGETVPVGTPIVRLGTGDSAADGAPAEEPAAPAVPATQAAANPEEAEKPREEVETPQPTAAEPQPPSAPVGQGTEPTPDQQQPAPDQQQPAPDQQQPVDAKPQPEAKPQPASSTASSDGGEETGRLKASPLARRLAEEKGIDLRQVKGSGPLGRILRDDVIEFSQRPAPAAPQPKAPAAPAKAPAAAPPVPAARPVAAGVTIKELTAMRQAIARRLQESKQQIPHFYVTVEIRMDAALALRGDLVKAAGDDLKITVNDFVLKAAALALVKFPQFNAWFVDGKIQLHERINLGLAVALDEGLVVPALLDCQNKSLGQISSAARDLIQRARKGSLKPEEFSGGTFSVSNLGMFGVDVFQAIINPPQVGILAVGAAQKRPVVDGDTLAVGTLMQTCLSCDHRVTDGADAARFLGEMKKLLENPMLMLL